MVKEFMPEEQRARRIVAAVKAVAGQVGRSMAQVALAWLRYRPAPVITIIGARKLSQLKDNLASADVSLSGNQLKTLMKPAGLNSDSHTNFTPGIWFVA